MPILSNANQLKRFACAKAHQNWTAEHWSRVLFTDKNRFSHPWESVLVAKKRWAQQPGSVLEHGQARMSDGQGRLLRCMLWQTLSMQRERKGRSVAGNPQRTNAALSTQPLRSKQRHPSTGQRASPYRETGKRLTGPTGFHSAWLTSSVTGHEPYRALLGCFWPKTSAEASQQQGGAAVVPQGKMRGPTICAGCWRACQGGFMLSSRWRVVQPATDCFFFNKV